MTLQALPAGPIAFGLEGKYTSTGIRACERPKGAFDGCLRG